MSDASGEESREDESREEESREEKSRKEESREEDSRKEESREETRERESRKKDSGEEESSSKQSKVSETVTVDDVTESNSQDDAIRSSMMDPTEDERNFKHIFLTPAYMEPRHPILSSPFCRNIAAMAYGPTKPRWYQALASSQLYLFRDIINYVTVGRSGYFHFDRFVEALQDFEPSISRGEVVGILENMEKSPFEELDFGKFLFLLAFQEQTEESENSEGKDDDDGEDSQSSGPTVTARQCLILSAISYFVLITTRYDIERYYYANTRRKATVLHYHMEAARLTGISEEAMELKQKKAAKNLGPLHRLTASPYTLPVPYVPSFRKGQIYRDWKAKYGSKSHTVEKMKRGPTVQIKMRELGDKPLDKTGREKLTRAVIYGNIPLPEIRFPHEVIEHVKETGFTVQMKEYLVNKAEEARKEYRLLLKDAGVICSEYYLRPILNHGFPTNKARDTFMEVYQRYFPLDVNDWRNFSLWVKPLDFPVGNHRGPLYPEKIAFGKIFK